MGLKFITMFIEPGLEFVSIWSRHGSSMSVSDLAPIDETLGGFESLMAKVLQIEFFRFFDKGNLRKKPWTACHTRTSTWYNSHATFFNGPTVT